MIGNRKARRRQKALQRRHDKRAACTRLSFCGAVIASASLGILAGADPNEAHAQVVLNPPGTIPVQCTVTGGATVCEGDLSAGLDADGPPLTDLTIQDLTTAVMPTAGTQGIDFDAAGNSNAALTVDTGLFGITTTNAEAIDVQVGGNGDITITSTGTITTQGTTVRGIQADVANDGSITIDASGSLTTTGNSIDADVNGNGAITIRSTANVNSDFDGIDGNVTGNGSVFIQSDGIINAPVAGRNAIDANVGGTTSGTVTVISNALIISGSDGIDADVETGTVTVVSNAQINAGDEGIDAAVDTNGSVTIQANSGIYTTGTFSNGVYAEVRGDGNVTVTSVGNIGTSGDDSRGIYANVDGNGIVTVNSSGTITTQGTDSEGIRTEVANPGLTGSITITANAAISTNGANGSEAIQAEVDGSGSITITTNAALSTQGIASEGIEAKVEEIGTITITSNGPVSTTGFSSEGIDAAIAGAGTLNITSNGPISTTGNVSQGIEADIAGNGDTIVRSYGPITTTGSDSEGIQARTSGTGSITVTSTGDISARGASSDGIFVSAPGSSTVNVSDSSIEGGTTDGVGVSFVGAAGGTNTLNTSGTVTLSSLGGTAVDGGAGNTTINNFGTLNTVTNGAIELGAGTNAFNNMGGAIFNSGGIVNLGAGNLFSNPGTLSPGASGAILTTAITGTLVQTSGGIFLASVNPSAGTGDLVTVTGTANLAGAVQAEVVDPALGDRSVTILSAAGGTTNNGLGLLASPALQASLSFPNANDVVLNYSIDFSAGGLNPNQTALANSLNSIAAAGSGGVEPVLLALLNNVFTIGDYRNALNQLLPEVVLNNETASLFSAEGFVDNLFSCRLAGQNHTALSEGECYWARPQGRFLDRDSDANTIGFDETSGGLAAGAQVAVAPNWFAGFALGYERASLDTDTGAETDSNRFSGGLSLKYQAGSFLLGAAISGGVSGNDTQRPISIGGAGGFNASAESNYAIKSLTGQARAAYVFQFRDWFVKPLVDVTATYLSRDGVTESGAGAANLAIAGSDETFFSVTPALEIGGDFALSETSTLRPYVRAGVSFYTDSDHGLTASFVNAPAGTSAFSITSDFDDVFADVAAGATAFFDNGSSLGLSYEGLISSDTQQNGISVKGTIAF